MGRMHQRGSKLVVCINVDQSWSYASTWIKVETGSMSLGSSKRLIKSL